MSRADIVQVTTLAAHLAYATFLQADDMTAEVRITRGAADCASDAMLLQKLGRRTRSMYAKMRRDFRGVTIAAGLEETARIEKAGGEILSPYGLSCHVEFERQFVIDGLPGNALGSTTDGFTL